MRATYRVLAGLIAGLVAVQAATVAWNTFTIIALAEAGEVITEDNGYGTGAVLHGTIGMMVMPVLALALLVVALVAKVPGGVRWAAVVLGVVVLQVVLAFTSFSAPAVGLLHGLNALVLFVVAGRAAALGRAGRHGPSAPTAAAAPERATATTSGTRA